MLKQSDDYEKLTENFQPPSGGCVLKQKTSQKKKLLKKPAAFRRLCVETASQISEHGCISQPPSGGCVLKPFVGIDGGGAGIQPPSGGCVLKQEAAASVPEFSEASRLQAAVC